MEPAERFAAIVNGPERDIRLDEAALCIAACARTDIAVDIDAWRARLDAIASDVGASDMGASDVGASNAGTSTFEAVRHELFAVRGFRGDTDDYGDPRNSFLDAVIERRRGIPITLSVVLIEVARRCGITLLGVGMPGHFLVQEADVYDQWCDPFHEGAVLDRDACARLFAATYGPVRRLEEADLAPTPPRAILSRILTNLEYGRFGQDPRRRAELCALHLTLPDVPVGRRVQLLHALAGAAPPTSVIDAYERVASDARDDDVANALRAEARLLRARWN
jgi:regulator of sirC expression with transglutaminase-like and TPR domain